MDYDRTAVLVDTTILTENMKKICAKAPRGMKICAVIKANAYGHGAFECYKAMKKGGTSRFAVAMWQEGAELREQGVTEPILILGNTADESMGEVLRYDLTPAIFSVEMAQALSRACVEQQKPCKIHLKMDTGMGRIGFSTRPEELEQTVSQCRSIQKLPGLEVEGLFTHFARADELNKASAKEQTGRFYAVWEALKQAGLSIPIAHCDNSAAIMELVHPETAMQRAGIISYGLYPSDEVDPKELPLRPALRWEAKVSFVKTVPAGTPISYGGTFVTTRESRIATIPVGYADGYNRLLSNRGKVLIGGQEAPVVGRVCMDQFMVDVTELPPVRRGDRVVLLGDSLSAEWMAGILGTINYEVVCDISARVPRLYLTT